jgi:hypothetical protein
MATDIRSPALSHEPSAAHRVARADLVQHPDDDPSAWLVPGGARPSPSLRFGGSGPPPWGGARGSGLRWGNQMRGPVTGATGARPEPVGAALPRREPAQVSADRDGPRHH